MWALMDHNVQLLEDFKHANLDAPGVPPALAPIAQPAVMVRPPPQGPSTACFLTMLPEAIRPLQH